MEIVCESCNARYYLSDDKIPLETKTGKCKKCGALITVIGKNAINSNSIIQQEISVEQEPTKHCEFCGEKILAIAKKCRYCSSMLDGSHADNSQNETEKTIKPSENINNIDSKIDENNNTINNHLSNHYQTAKKRIKAITLTIFLLVISIAIIISFQIYQLPKDVTTILEYRNGVAYLPNGNKPFTGKFEAYYSTDIFGATKIDYDILKVSKVFLSKEVPEISLEKHIEGYSETLLQKWKHKFFNEQKAFEESYKNGNLNGLSMSWEKNGRKESEINYENGKLKGLSTRWYDDGKKQSINFTGIITKDLSEEQIDEAIKNKLIEKIVDDIEGVTVFRSIISSDCVGQILKNLKQVLCIDSYMILFKDTKKLVLMLKATYISNNWLFINSFIVLADDRKFNEENIEFSRKNISDKIEEWYVKSITSVNDFEMIKAIVESKKAIIRFKGNNNFYDYEITDSEKRKMKILLDTYKALGGQFENWEE